MRHTTPFVLSAVLVGTVVLTGCASRDVNSVNSANSSAAPTCAVPTPTGGAAGSKRENVTIVSPGCRTSPGSTPEFEVTNTESEPFTYTVTFSVLNTAGEVLDSIPQTVASVAPGRTVRQAVDTGQSGSMTAGSVTSGSGASGSGTAKAGSQLRIAKVRAVPTSEAPVAAGVCPPSGIRVAAGEVEAAMGLRAMGLRLTNCGSGAYRVNGYPRLQVLDEERKPVDGIRILQGTDRIATGVVPDAAPQPVTLQPGESASATLAWRNTTGSGDPVNVPYVRVTAQTGAPSVIVTPELDLGTTGQIGASAWKHA
ncbi:DUF4232 domain-containing protein [Kitasatospora sp. NPDC008050]|uniref:DUF4232 domain-containing protein n=1 Tax=Kitasatospora sp. NPDC008050 TaxID=3364021 RepID=UPI0036ED1448